MDATANADRGRTPPGLRLALGSWVSGRGRSGGAHPSLCSASNCHLVRRRSLGGGKRELWWTVGYERANYPHQLGGRSAIVMRLPITWLGLTRT
jgi:hypothetical protein